MLPDDSAARAPARLMTIAVDRTCDPPRALVHIVEGTSSRHGSLADARAFLDDVAALCGQAVRHGR